MHHGSILNSDGSVGKFRKEISRDGAIASIMNVLAEKFHGMIPVEKKVQTRNDLSIDLSKDSSIVRTYKRITRPACAYVYIYIHIIYVCEDVSVYLNVKMHMYTYVYIYIYTHM